MSKIRIDLVKGAEGYSLQVQGLQYGYRIAGPKAWGNPYNKPTASFEINADELISCIQSHQYDGQCE